MSNTTPPLFIESLKVVNGIFIRPELHLKRIQQTQKEVLRALQNYELLRYFRDSDSVTHKSTLLSSSLSTPCISSIYQHSLQHFDVEEFCNKLKECIPLENQQGTQKCRIIYNQTIQQIEFSPYQARPIRSLKLVDGTDIDYHLKYYNRSKLTELLRLKGDCDDILITQNNRITDTTYSNIVVFDGTTYFTPITYLLNGTKRQYLLQKGVIKELDIKVSDLKQFNSLHLINAMLDIEDGIRIETSDINIGI